MTCSGKTACPILTFLHCAPMSSPTYATTAALPPPTPSSSLSACLPLRSPSARCTSVPAERARIAQATRTPRRPPEPQDEEAATLAAAFARPSARPGFVVHPANVLVPLSLGLDGLIPNQLVQAPGGSPASQHHPLQRLRGRIHLVVVLADREHAEFVDPRRS